ncbi:MAG: polysaccharide deacetylase family protein [Steroidobacteraceae bacterium]|nr:polysaccharide deacetylase family protein [Steroidobacteraceae bacterium]MDW8260197.1 polysaccharide deacetylase family protein [Gammaproteobacteria bacterium]
MKLLLRYAARCVSGRNGDRRLLVLIFHRVLAEPDPLLPGEPDAATFRRLMRFLALHFRVLPLADAVRRLQGGDLPAGAVCVTFDDGYANNFKIALPILIECGIPATVFVASGYLDGGIMFNDRIIETLRQARRRLDLSPLGLGIWPIGNTAERSAAAEALIRELKYRPPEERERISRQIAQIAETLPPSDLMMTRAEVAALHRAGIEIGAHTVNHPILNTLDPQRAEREIAGSKTDLEAIIGAPVRSFAYPNGRPHTDYSAVHVAAVKRAGFTVALSTAWGAASRDSDPLQLPRIAPWDRSLWRYGLRMVAAYRARASTAS